MKASTLGAIASALFMGLTAASALASSIPIINGNFSTLPVGGLDISDYRGNYTYFQGIPGWIAPGDVGQWDPNGVELSPLAGSPIVAFSNGGTISQTVTPTVVAGAVYTLTVELGDRIDDTFDGGADLWINGVAYDATGTPVFGGWSTFTATYTGLAADAGDSITIQLTSTGLEGEYANVILDTTAATGVVPEPSSFLLLGSGLVGFAGMLRRKLKA